jgi:hypothetical protein
VDTGSATEAMLTLNAAELMILTVRPRIIEAAQVPTDSELSLEIATGEISETWFSAVTMASAKSTTLLPSNNSISNKWPSENLALTKFSPDAHGLS